jgi:hypothetical protein
VSIIEEIVPASLNTVMEQDKKIVNEPMCGLCGDEADDLYECETCKVQACGGCIGLCEDCETALVCCKCYVVDDDFDPWCPRCATSRSRESD